MYILIVYQLFMMAQKNNNFETPVKKPPKWCYWYLDSPLKRVTKDLFGVRKSRLNNAEFFVLHKNPEGQKLLADGEQEKVDHSM